MIPYTDDLELIAAITKAMKMLINYIPQYVNKVVSYTYTKRKWIRKIAHAFLQYD